MVLTQGIKEHELGIYVHNDQTDCEVDQLQYLPMRLKNIISLRNNNLVS